MRVVRSPLVTADWLAAQTGGIVVLDATIDRGIDAIGKTTFQKGQSLYEAGHIPGARFADLFDGFSDPDAPFLFTRPSPGQLQAAARSLGIHRDTIVVVYDGLSGAWAARVWWVLRSFGCQSVYVLDGGLNAWTRSGRPLETGGATMSWLEGDFVADTQDGFFVDLSEVRGIALASQASGDPLVCATRRVEFLGQASDGTRAGHIPGSVNLPYSDLLDAEGCVDAAKGRDAWRALGCADKSRPILYCGGGINAAGLALVLTAAGFEGMTIFDGSLNEWRADATLPMATGE
ncbi:sulfurtransferase [Acidisoma cladoniae]|uniref:sulfurtransferase n=1 Tax=Acidisoma cladoniae TaxID=3040935 RepID=UPI0025507105|nr:sulfurtransferase [Acidisoma sp. PAMC 29798]